MTIRRKKKGFTLGEVLVTIAIIAVLAAVMIPSIGSQLTKGDQSHVEQDLQALSSAIQQFLADVHRYPSNVAQLIRKPTTLGADSALNGTGGAYNANQISRWRGPYLSKDSVAATNTGFGGVIGPFIRDSTGGVGGQVYLTIKITGIDSLSAVKIDNDMDDGVPTTGSIRLLTGTILKYFALPIQ